MRKLYTKILFTLALSVIGSVAVMAQNIKGRVTDGASGTTLPGVSVQIVGTSKGAVSDASGVFTINSGAGKFQLKASFVGYESQTFSVNVSGGDATLNISMKESSSLLGDVQVVGSRATTSRTNVSTTTPVDVITTKELKGYSQVDVSQILNFVAPSFNSNRQTVTDGTDHIDPASLRGLGPDQVLVLVNGKRRHNTSLVNINGSVGRGAVGTDMNVIPVAAIERIEVLRDGAAAQYGSDAIAGVINVVLKKDYKGTSASLTYGQNMTTLNYNAPVIGGGVKAHSHSLSDGGVLQFDFSQGLKLGKKGAMSISAQYNDRQRTNRSGLDNAPTIFLGSAGSFAGTPAGQVTNDFRTKLIADDATLVSQRGYNRNNMVFGNSSAQNLGLFANGSIAPSDKSEIYFAAGLTTRKGTGFGNNRIPNSRNQQPLKADGTLFYQDGFLPGIESKINDISLILGYKTKLGEWAMDLSNTYGKNAFGFTVYNSGNATLPNSDTQQTTFDAGTLKFSQNTTNLDFSRKYDNMGALDYLNIAFGAEYRTDNFQIIAGEPASYSGAAVSRPTAPLTIGGASPGTVAAAPGAQVFPGYQPSNEINKSRNNKSLYIDLEGETGRLLLGVAGRFENYSDFGSTFNGKISARLQITENIALRGATSTGFRAPSLQQRYFQNTSTQFISGIPANTLTVNNDDPISRTTVGVDALKPETSSNLSLGLTAKIGRGFSFTADAYQINIKNRILYSGAFSRAQLGFAATEYLGINNVRFFTNAANTTTKGIDIVATQRMDLGKGKLVVSAAINFNKNEVTALNTTPIIDKPENNELRSPDPGQWYKNIFFDRQQRALIENYLPTSKLNFSAAYSINKFDINLRAVRFGEVKYIHNLDPYAVNPTSTAADKRYNSQFALDAGGQALIDQTFSALVQTDLVVGYKINKMLYASVGANNLFDVYPDQIFIDPRNAIGSIDYNSGRDASNRGRLLFQPNQGGYNGRFVFARLALSL